MGYGNENLMTQIDLPDGSHNYFSYDADGKRTSIGDSEGSVISGVGHIPLSSPRWPG